MRVPVAQGRGRDERIDAERHGESVQPRAGWVVDYGPLFASKEYPCVEGVDGWRSRWWWCYGASLPAAAQAPAAKKGKAPAVSAADARLEALKRAVTAEIDGMAGADAADGGQPLLLRRARLPGIRDQAVLHRHPARRTASAIQENVAGMPTGVDGDLGQRASRSSRSAPTSTACRARRRSRASRITSRSSRARPGHGEGHNSGMPLNITAALAVKKIMEREKIAGHDRRLAGRRRGTARRQGVVRRAPASSRTSTSSSSRTSASNFGVSWGDGERHRPGLGRVHLQRDERARRRRAVARPQRARRRRADGRRLELPPRAPAPLAALALRHHQRRRSAERRAAARRASGTTSARSTTRTSRRCGTSATRWPRAPR